MEYETWNGLHSTYKLVFALNSMEIKHTHTTTAIVYRKYKEREREGENKTIYTLKWLISIVNYMHIQHWLYMVNGICARCKWNRAAHNKNNNTMKVFAYSSWMPKWYHITKWQTYSIHNTEMHLQMHRDKIAFQPFKYIAHLQCKS